MPVFKRGDPFFPKTLLTVRPPVSKIFVAGRNWRQKTDFLLTKRVITVVGSRKMTRYGEQVIEKLIPPLVEAGIVIVSGFMYGVDQQAHRLCLDCGGSTVAVLGWGIDWPVSPVEEALYRQIYDKGLLLSEYPKNTAPQLWMFPARDRLMAGLGQAVIVVEAALKSGSLITARKAKEYRRKLFSVPGPITSAVSLGTNGLIKSGLAIPIDSAADIFTVMGWPKIDADNHLKNPSQSQLLNHLTNEPLSLDELSQKCRQPVAKLAAELSVLQLQGTVKEEDGKFYLKPNAD